MSQKNFFTDRRTKTVHRFVVAGEIGQWDCPKAQTKSAVGLQMDTSVSQQHEELVSGSIPQPPPDGSAGEQLLRTIGHPNPSPAQKHKNPSGVLWSGGNLQRADRSSNLSLAQHLHDPSDPSSSQACDPQASRPVSKGANPARPYGQKTKRRPSDRLLGHYLAFQHPLVVLNRKDMVPGLVFGTEEPDRRVQCVLAFFARDWQLHGIPRFLQMDNDMSLTGGRMHPRSLGQLVRFCLACRVIAVFTPPRRPASNALVERYNGLWQEKVWQRPKVTDVSPCYGVYDRYSSSLRSDARQG